MTTQYTPILKLALPVTGELSGTWGDVVNDNITSMVEQAIAGLATISTWTGNSHTLTTANGTTSESRCAMLVAQNGAGLTAAGEIVCPASSKLYVLKNDTSYTITLKTAAGTGVAVVSGNTAFLFCDGTNVNACVTTIVDGRVTGNLTVDGNATVNGNTTLGNATSDTITATARFASDLVPSADNTRDLGSTANSWKDLYIDGTAYLALVDINGGTIDGVSIGASTAATIINVDNLRLDGNTISSTDTNGNVVIAPNGTGDVQLDADTVRVGDSGAAATLTSNGAGALTVTTGGAADLTLSTNSGTTSGTIVIANGAGGNITLTPEGTGDVILSADRVQIGDANTDTTLTTNGTGSLNLTTNNGTNSGTIQIAQGANGNITLTPNGTGSVSVPKLVWSNGTSGRVPYLTTGGQFTDDADMTFDGTTLTVNGLTVSGTATFSGGTADRVVFLNGSKQASTSANLTFDGTTLGVNTLSLTNALAIASGGTNGTATPTAGAVAYGTGTAYAFTLAGTSGQILTSSGTGAPTWTSLSSVGVTTLSFGTTGLTPNTATSGAITVAGTLITSNGGTGLSSYTAGDLPYYASGTALSKLGIGTNGQILTSSGTAPQWTTLSGVAVTTFSGGTTGLTPASATSGTITLGGTLATTNGGTGLTSFTANRVFYASSSSAIGSSANLTFDGTTLTAANFADSSLTSGRVTYAGASGNLTDSANLTFNGTTLNAAAITENSSPVVVQSDIGTAPNEIPLNQYLGTMAYQDGTNYFNTGMTVGFRNRLINGAMQIDQRNAGASTTPTTDSTYTLDRWICRLSQASKFSVQQVSTAPSNFTNSLKVTSLSAYSVGTNDYFSVGQRIEGLNVSDLGFGTSTAKSITVSFWVYSSLTGTFSGGLANSGYTRNFAFTYTINNANTWEQKTVNVSGDTSGTWLTSSGVGLILQFSLGSGSTYSDAAPNGWSNSNPAVQNTVSVLGTNGATWYVTGVQVEVGTQATPFDWRPYTTEYQLCQRYFEKSIADGTAATATANPAPTLVAAAYNTTAARTQVFYKTPKRATPTLTTIPAVTVGTGNQWGWYNGAWNGGATSIAHQNANAFSIDIAGTYTQFYSYIIDGNWYASAEL